MYTHSYSGAQVLQIANGPGGASINDPSPLGTGQLRVAESSSSSNTDDAGWNNARSQSSIVTIATSSLFEGKAPLCSATEKRLWYRSTYGRARESALAVYRKGTRRLCRFTLPSLHLINLNDTALFMCYAVGASVDLPVGVSVYVSVRSWRDVVG